MLVFATLLSEGTDTFMNPLVAVNLDLLCRRWTCGDDSIYVFLLTQQSMSAYSVYVNLAMEIMLGKMARGRNKKGRPKAYT